MRSFCGAKRLVTPDFDAQHQFILRMLPYPADIKHYCTTEASEETSRTPGQPFWQDVASLEHETLLRPLTCLPALPPLFKGHGWLSINNELYAITNDTVWVHELQMRHCFAEQDSPAGRQEQRLAAWNGSAHQYSTFHLEE